MSSPPRIYLIDAHSQIFRAFHAIRGLSNSEGLPTNAVYGFTNMVRKLIREEEPDYLVAVFDPPGPTVRHETYEDYKKSRPDMPEDLAVQLPYIKRVLEALRVAILEIPEYEADDVIGTLVKRAVAEGMQAVIVSQDKDLLQLLEPGVEMLSERGSNRVVYDEEAVEEKYGIPAELIPDFLGLIGDKIDDIPGVPGVGKVGGRKLLQEYGSLEEVLAHAEEVSHKTYRENLQEYAAQARMSKELATVHLDLELDLGLDEMERREPDVESCRELFAELEFRSLQEEFTRVPEEDPAGYRTLEGRADLEEALEAIREAGRVSLDLETTSQEPMRADLVGVALSWKEERAWYLPVAHTHLGSENAVSPEEALELLEPVIADPDVEVVGQNLKYDLIVLARHGLEGVHADFDTMVASYVLNPTRQSHGLDSLALDFLGVKTIPFSDVVPSKDSTFADVPVESATRYACEDADYALRLTSIFEAELVSQDLDDLYRELELPLIDVLVAMERQGVGIDTDYLEEMGRELAGQLEEIEAEVFETAGTEFNLNSPQQLAEVLFDRLELPVLGRTSKTGRRSTRAEVLEKLAEEHPIAQRILDYRELSKLKGTYVDALPELVHPETGRIHASFNQTVAATGRLSSSDPNLQNIPVRTEVGRRIRRAFVPAPGTVMMTADYSQIELRIMAHLSGDEALREAFATGADVHRQTAASIFDVEPDEVDSTQRDRAKVINFGIMYGMGPQRLAREFGITLDEAREFIDRYKETYSGVARFLEETVERARDTGYVKTMMGRIRHLPELQSSQGRQRAFGERVAVNTPIQGTAADLIKLAMIRLHRRLPEEGLEAAMTIQVHDELVLEVPEDEVEATAAVVEEEMVGALELEVPLEVDIGSGPNWLEAKP